MHRYPSHNNTCLCFVLVFICVHCFCRKWTRGTGGAYNRACLLPRSGLGDINCNSFLRALFFSPFYQRIFIIFEKTILKKISQAPFWIRFFLNVLTTVCLLWYRWSGRRRTGVSYYRRTSVLWGVNVRCTVLYVASGFQIDNIVMLPLESSISCLSVTSFRYVKIDQSQARLSELHKTVTPNST